MGVGAAAATPFVPPTVSSSGAGTAGGAGKSAFAQGLQSLQDATTKADGLAQGVATGGLQDVHQFTSAAAKAQLGVELTVALRNRAVEAYQDIMRMQV
jgi:flagellar hook-basal body complex protein FliE